MAGELFILIERTGDRTVNNAVDHPLPDFLGDNDEIVFEAPDGMTDFSVNQSPKPQG